MNVLLKDAQFLGDIYFWQRIQRTFNTGRVYYCQFYYCQLIIFCNLGVPSLSDSNRCPDQKAKVNACVILALRDIGAITLWNRHPSGVKDNATSLDNIKDACDGKAVSRSKYVCNNHYLSSKSKFSYFLDWQPIIFAIISSCVSMSCLCS